MAGNRMATAMTNFFVNYVFKQYCQHAIWLQRISEDMVGETGAPGYDPIREVETVTSDGTYGEGYEIMQNGVLRHGYLAPKKIQVMIFEQATSMRLTPEGYSEYTPPHVVTDPCVSLRKGDILVLEDGRRLVVADEWSPGQVFGTTVLKSVTTEERDTDNIIYQIPLT